MKITIELDFDDPQDARALDRLLGRDVVNLDPIARGAAMGKAASELGSMIGDKPKLNPTQKAKVAAQTRWKGKGKKKHSTPPVASKRERSVDISKSTERDSAEYPRDDGGGDFGFPDAPPWPDGRELIEGTFQRPPEPPKEKTDERPKAVDDIIEP